MLTTKEKQLNEKIKEMSFHVKHDTQIVNMLDSHQKKLEKVTADLQEKELYPDALRYQFYKELKDINYPQAKLNQEVERRTQEELNYLAQKKAKLEEAVTLLDTEIKLRADKKVMRKPVGTTYYIDFDNGNDSNDGLGTGAGNAWATLEKFCSNARSAGDIAIVRRGMSQTASAALNFTSDGTNLNPIKVTADYTDAWGDFSNSSETATFTFGSKTVTFTGDVSAEISAGDWIYNSTDDEADEFAYEVASVSTNTVTLYLPFKGTTGSGKTVTIMPANPSWGQTNAGYYFYFSSDDYWSVQGIHIKTNYGTGAIRFNSASPHFFKDMIIEGNPANVMMIMYVASTANFKFIKGRVKEFQYGFYSYAGQLYGLIKDCLLDAGSVPSARPFDARTYGQLRVEECETLNVGAYDVSFHGSSYYGSDIRVRNTKFSASSAYVHVESPFCTAYVEDYNNTVGDNRKYKSARYHNTFTDLPYKQSETSTVRSGGSNKSIKIIPGNRVGANWEWSWIEIFDDELGIYLPASQKTITVYFNAPSANFTSAPTASELWLEIEYWGHATNKHRRVTKSTGTIAADGTWDGLSVTITPAIAGVAYLRAYYNKSLEGGKTNIFYVDPIPEIT